VVIDKLKFVSRTLSARFCNFYHCLVLTGALYCLVLTGALFQLSVISHMASGRVCSRN